MKKIIERFQGRLQRPLPLLSRVFLIVGVLCTLFLFKFPLWNMSFESNQYPDPLRLAIHIHQLEGQKTAMRDDLREINSLNHYIGMRPLLESDFSEFQWMPFVIGIFVLISLRAVVFGSLRDLIDIVVLYAYFCIFSGWNFYNRLYQYGHNLNGDAPIKVEPFTPPFFGKVQIANFRVESFPAGGSFALGAFGCCLLIAAVVAWRSDSPADRGAA